MRRQLIPLSGTVLLIASIAAAGEEQRVLPRNMTDEERAAMEANLFGYFIWDCFPDIAGFTDPPPLTSRFPTESEQTRGAMYGWPSYGSQMAPLTELIRNSVQQDGYETTVMVSNESQRLSAIATLTSRDFDADMLSRINWFITPLNGIWIRDYGAEVLITPDGNFQFVDMGYYSSARGTCTTTPDQMPQRPSDDVSPTRFAPNLLGGVDVFRPMLRTEGGNLQTDGQGTCVHMQRDVLAENNFNGDGISWHYAQGDLDAVYTNYFNCFNVITLESLQRDPGGLSVGQNIVIDHVDMFMSFISPQTVIVARLDDEDAAIDPANAGVLDRNAQTLSDAGYNVVRIPQPARYCTVHHSLTCVASCESCPYSPGANETRECAGSGLDRVWATYANSIRVGNRMMVPVYHDPMADDSPLSQDVKDRIWRQETEALNTFQAALDAEYGEGAVTVVPVVSDDMIPCQGSMHCISMTYGPPPMQ